MLRSMHRLPRTLRARRQSRYARRVRAVLPFALLALPAGCDKLFGLRDISGEPGDAALVTDGPFDGRDAPGDTVEQTHSNCPAGFGQPYENSRYRFVSTAVTWSEAMQFCASLDDPTSTRRVHLVVLTSDFERSQHVYVNVVGSFSAYWLGYSDTKVEGAYQWVTGELLNYPSASAWGPSEPSMDPGDNCVRVSYSNNDLDSMLCTTPTPFVCECDDYALVAANYTLM